MENGKSSEISIKVSVIKDVAEAIGVAADGLVKLGDAVAHLVKLGKSGADYMAARKTRERMKDLLTNMQNISLANEGVDPIISDYLDQKHSTMNYIIDSINLQVCREKELINGVENRSEHGEKFVDSYLEGQWNNLRNRLIYMDELIKKTVSDLEKDARHLALHKFYMELRVNIYNRGEIVKKLLSISRPKEMNELEELEKLAYEYRRLKDQLRKIIDGLADLV